VDGISSGKAPMVGPHEKPIKLVAELRDEFKLGSGDGKRKPGEADDD